MYQCFGSRKLRFALPPSPPQMVRQGITERALEPAEMRAFLVTLRGLAGYHGRLPDRVMITEKIKDLDDIHTFGVFGDVRAGTHNGLRVAVKTARVLWSEDLERIRKVGIDDILLRAAASPQPFCSSDSIGKPSSGARYPTQISWNLSEFRRTQRAGSSPLC